MIKRIQYFIPLLISCMSISVFAQEAQPILLNNPSFEDMPRHSKEPRGWFDCGDQNESPPDVQPNGGFGVSKDAVDGSTYLGLVVRDNDTWESVGQRLNKPIEANKCYEFSLALSRSGHYVSLSRTTEDQANYVTPAKVRIWGGSSYCNKQELLDETSLITNTEWLKYNFRFEPKSQHTYIVIEAFYKTPTLFPYNGNVLVDNATPITPIPCDDPVALEVEEIVPEVLIAGNDKPVNIPPKNKPTKVEPPTPPVASTPPPPTTTTPVPPRREDNTTLGGFKRDEIKEGQTIKLERLFFEADKANITNASHEELDELYKFLKRNGDVLIEIGGHTNSTPSHEYCDRLSTNRAKSVADYLNEKGIDERRLKYKGYGKRKPIASNKTAAGRKRNQRVEIKVLGFSG